MKFYRFFEILVTKKKFESYRHAVEKFNYSADRIQSSFFFFSSFDNQLYKLRPNVDVNQMSGALTCTDHPKVVLVEDARAGDVICSACGVVVGDRWCAKFIAITRRQNYRRLQRVDVQRIIAFWRRREIAFHWQRLDVDRKAARHNSVGQSVDFIRSHRQQH